jgi:hypothetical protein
MFKKVLNIPMKFVPNFSRGNGKVFNKKFSQADQKHMQLTTFGTQHTTYSDFNNIDSCCQLLPTTLPSATWF